jgi:hypothetical protein
LNPVLVYMRVRILETGVISLLNAAGDLPAMRIQDRRTLKGEILKMQPCVVILETESPGDQTAHVLEFLDIMPQLRVLLVHLESNVVDVYDKRQITLSDASDLIDLINQSKLVASPIQA